VQLLEAGSRDALLQLLASSPPELSLMEEVEVLQIKRLPIFCNLAGELIPLDTGGLRRGEWPCAAVPTLSMSTLCSQHLPTYCFYYMVYSTMSGPRALPMATDNLGSFKNEI
jgi:hypothetical protein